MRSTLRQEWLQILQDNSMKLKIMYSSAQTLHPTSLGILSSQFPPPFPQIALSDLCQQLLPLVYLKIHHLTTPLSHFRTEWYFLYSRMHWIQESMRWKVKRCYSMMYFAVTKANCDHLWKFTKCCCLLFSSEMKIFKIAFFFFFYKSQSHLRLASMVCGVFICLFYSLPLFSLSVIF